MSTARPAADELGHVTWSLDLAVAGLLAVLTVVPLLLLDVAAQVPQHALTPQALTIRSALLGLGLCAATVLRRRRPLVTLALTTLLCLLHLCLLPVPTPALLCVLLVAYSVARWVGGHRARLVLALALVGAVAGPARWVDFLAEYASGGGFPTTMFIHVLIYIVL